MVLLIDNYDSFVHNLARYIRLLGWNTEVVRNDRMSVAEIRERAPRVVVLSPGPCTPAEAGISTDVVRALAGTVPVLGVCLGLQCIATAFGGALRPASRPVHGRATQVFHEGEGIFAGLPSPFLAGRYHSLVVDGESLPETLSVTATALDGGIMALRHSAFAVWGVQFHPESVLTEHGTQLLRNFLALATATAGAGAWG